MIACPYLFKNANLQGITIFSQVDSFFFNSLFRFQDDESKNISNLSSINSMISVFEVKSGYNYILDTSLLHPLVFEHLSGLICKGTIKSIQTDLFKHFPLTRINIFVNSLGNFYHRIGIEWLNFVKIGCLLDLTSEIPYIYPDRDFCIFSHFPTNRSFVLVLDYPELNGTFTFMWLCYLGQMNSKLCGNWTASQEDNLKTFIKLCEIKENQTADDAEQKYLSYPEYYQTRLVGMLFAELVPFVLTPCACLLGLFFNWKIVQTIKQNKKKELKEDFYKYMSANAKFNCLYCLIFVFYPMTSCTWRQSNFCSTIFTTQFVQYFKIVVMAYFGEVIKMCANISYLMMTLNRYLLIGKDHAPWLVTLAKQEFKLVIRGSLLFSALINIGHGWEYRYSVFYKDNDVAYNGLVNGYAYSEYPESNQGTPYFIYSIVYFLINFGVLFILNTGIEIKLVRRMHKELTEKRERLAKMSASAKASSSSAVTATVSASKTLDTAEQEKNKKDEEEDERKERRVIKMVVFNGVFNFFLRAPECVSWMENENVWTSVFNVFSAQNVWNGTNYYMPGILNLIADIGYFSYILTFTTNFFIYYKFNNKFNEAVVFFWTSTKPKTNTKK
jgi:hypothetical protein